MLSKIDRGLLMASWGYAKKPLLILSAVALIDQIDTNILRGVVPFIQDDFKLSDLQVGLLTFAFVFVNALATIPAGWIADRYRRTRIIGWTLLSWSGLSALSAIAINFPSLFLARAALGFGQAIDDPSSTSLLTDYYPPSVRGRAFSWQQISLFLGSAIGIGVGAVVADQIGWRWAFVLVGGPGSLIAFACFRMREPRRGSMDLADSGLQPAQPAYDEDHLEEAPKGESAPALSIREFAREAFVSLKSEMRMIFGIRTMRYVLIGVGILLFTVSGVGSFLTQYHDRYSGMTKVQAAGLTAVIFGIAGVLGTLLGGRYADRLHSGGPIGRIKLVSRGIAVCAVTFLVSFAVPYVSIRILLQMAGIFAIAGAIPALRASMMDVVPAESRGVSASAFALMSTLFGTALAPPLIGLLSDVTHSLVAAFYIVTPPILIGSLILRQAQYTVVDDAQKLITSMIERQQEANARAEAAANEHAAHNGAMHVDLVNEVDVRAKAADSELEHPHPHS